MSLSAPRIVPTRPRVFYGWWIVLATIVLLAYLAGAVFWSFSFFVSPMQAELGWSSEVIGSVYLVQGIAAAAVAPAAGALFDRFGPRRVAVGGVLLGGTGLVLWGRSEALWHFYLAFNLAGIGFTAIFASTIPAVANWFLRRRGLAIGLASLGIAFAGGMAPIVVVMVDRLEWRYSLVALGVGAWVLLMPLALLLRRRPEEHGQLPDGDAASPGVASGSEAEAEGATVREALRNPAFWLLGYAFLMGFWAIGAIQVHQSPYLEGVGISREVAASVIALLSLMTVLGRVAFGWLSDRTDPRRLTALALLIHGAGVAVFALVTEERSWLLVIFLLAFSPGLGGIMVLQPALQGYYFGRRAFGALSGINYAFSSISWSGGPYILGVMLGLFDSYQPGLYLFAALSLAGAPAVLLLRRPPAGGAAQQAERDALGGSGPVREAPGLSPTAVAPMARPRAQ